MPKQVSPIACSRACLLVSSKTGISVLTLALLECSRHAKFANPLEYGSRLLRFSKAGIRSYTHLAAPKHCHSFRRSKMGVKCVHAVSGKRQTMTIKQSIIGVAAGAALLAGGVAGLAPAMASVLTLMMLSTSTHLVVTELRCYSLRTRSVQ